jgi:hypothetical protein
VKHHKKLIIATLLAITTSSAQALETLIDFEDQTKMRPASTPLPSLTINDVTFESIQGGGFITTDLNITDPGVTELDYSGTYLFNGALGFSSLKFSFANTVSQFSFTLGDNQFPWELEAFDTENTSIASLIIDSIPGSSTNNGVSFGLSSLGSTGISYATLTQVGAPIFGSDTIEFDNLKYTTEAVSPVPEPSTYALMLGGLGMVGFMAYRRRKQFNA